MKRTNFITGSPIEICTSFVVFDGEQKFAQIDMVTWGVTKFLHKDSS